VVIYYHYTYTTPLPPHPSSIITKLWKHSGSADHRLKKLKATEFNNYKVENINKIHNDFADMMLPNNDTQYTQNNLAGVEIKFNLHIKRDGLYDPTEK